MENIFQSSLINSGLRRYAKNHFESPVNNNTSRIVTKSPVTPLIVDLGVYNKNDLY